MVMAQAGRPTPTPSPTLPERGASKIYLKIVASGPRRHRASGILDDEGQRRGKWVLLQVDWKATEEVEWQANELLTVAGITETWHLQGGTKTTVPRALLEFSSWVKPRGFRLLHLDLGNDAYYALLMSQDKSAEIVQMAKEAGLKVQESDEFEVENRPE